MWCPHMRTLLMTLSERGHMSETEAGLHVLHRVLLVLLVCLALFLVGCSGDPECFAVPFLPKCFDDDDDEKKPNDTATQASAIGSRVQTQIVANEIMNTPAILTA